VTHFAGGADEFKAAPHCLRRPTGQQLGNGGGAIIEFDARHYFLHQAVFARFIRTKDAAG
jgi:hypothetical protein